MEILLEPTSNKLLVVNVTRLRFRDTSASSAAICFFRDVSLCLLDIKSVLTRKAFEIFCQKFHIPEDVHPQLLVGKIGERIEEGAKILDSTVGRVVPLLPVTLARLKSELEASVERLFDEGGSADQGDSAAGGGQEVETGIATGVRIIGDENVVAQRPKRPRRKGKLLRMLMVLLILLRN
nr:hypothetical protein [Tanacetum cinerariifolium]